MIEFEHFLASTAIHELKRKTQGIWWRDSSNLELRVLVASDALISPSTKYFWARLSGLENTIVQLSFDCSPYLMTIQAVMFELSGCGWSTRCAEHPRVPGFYSALLTNHRVECMHLGWSPPMWLKFLTWLKTLKSVDMRRFGDVSAQFWIENHDERKYI